VNDDESEMELYGVSPWVIGFIMIVIALITPIGMVLTDGNVIVLYAWFQGPFVYGLLWVFNWSYYSYIDFHGFKLLDLPSMWFFVPLSIFSILYVRQIIRYYYGKSSRDSALMLGILSIIFPSILGLLTTVSVMDISYVGLIIPIPIQFIAGLILLRKFDGPEVISPWPGQFIDWSWWKRLKARWLNKTVDVVEMHLEEKHDEIDCFESE